MIHRFYVDTGAAMCGATKTFLPVRPVTEAFYSRLCPRCVEITRQRCKS